MVDGLDACEVWTPSSTAWQHPHLVTPAFWHLWYLWCICANYTCGGSFTHLLAIHLSPQTTGQPVWWFLIVIVFSTTTTMIILNNSCCRGSRRCADSTRATQNLHLHQRLHLTIDQHLASPNQSILDSSAVSVFVNIGWVGQIPKTIIRTKDPNNHSDRTYLPLLRANYLGNLKTKQKQCSIEYYFQEKFFLLLSMTILKNIHFFS